MPRENRRGPDEMGPMTGRGAGYCAGNDTPECDRHHRARRPWQGAGMRSRMGPQKGPHAGFRPEFRNGPWSYDPDYSMPRPDLAPESELEMLREDLKILKDQMDATEKRIKELLEDEQNNPRQQPEI